MSQQRLGPNRKQEFSQSWFDIKWLWGGQGRLSFYGSFVRGSEIKIRDLLGGGVSLVVGLFVGGFKHST